MAEKRQRKPYSVFISHSHQDRWIAKQWVRLIEETNKKGVRTFLDEKDIEGGDSIAEKIREGIRQCNELVVLLTPSSVRREWVVVEMSVAWGLKKRIVAILHHVSPKQMPDMSYAYKAIDLNDFEQYLDQLRKREKEKIT